MFFDTSVLYVLLSTTLKFELTELLYFQKIFLVFLLHRGSKLLDFLKMPLLLHLHHLLLHITGFWEFYHNYLDE
jgi:hypothetical protein